MALVEALSHRSKRVRRLLERAASWETGPPDYIPCSTRHNYRTFKQLRPAEVDLLAQRYTDGATVYELANQFGIHRATVGEILQRRGVATRYRKLSASQTEDIAHLYALGWSMARIGQKFDVSASTVMKKLRAQGVQTRDAQGRER